MDSVIPIDMLDDLCSRFIINVPEEERIDVIRICFQIELAHWFYIDFYKQKGNRRICNLKEFAGIVFRHVPFLAPFVERVDVIIDEWKEYKYSVPTYGAILLNEGLTHALLVQSYCSKTSWGFPKGKINKGESAWQCAIREVLEETGYDIRERMDPTEYVEATINDQAVRLYIIPGISMEQQFVPRTRNEIKSINWFSLADLPASKKEATTKLKTMSGSVSLFMVTPFVRKLRQWIYENYGRASATNPKSKRPRNKSCGDLDYLELKDFIGATSEKKKNHKKSGVDKLGQDEGDEAQKALSGHKAKKFDSSGSRTVTEADVKVRRTLEYVICQNPNIGSPPGVLNEETPNKKTPNKIRILKKSDNRTPSGKELLSSLFSNKELISTDNASPSHMRPSKKLNLDGKPATTDSPQSKSFGNLLHDRGLSSFARVSHKTGGRNYFINQSSVEPSKTPRPDEQTTLPKIVERLKFVEISFSKTFRNSGVRAWSNFKFDRQDLIKRMTG